MYQDIELIWRQKCCANPLMLHCNWIVTATGEAREEEREREREANKKEARKGCLAVPRCD